MNHRSLAFRLAVWYALLLSAAFALVGTLLFYGIDQYVRANLADSLRRRSEQVEQILQSPGPLTRSELADAVTTRVAPEFNNRFVRIRDAAGRVLYRSGQPSDRSFDVRSVPLTAWPAQRARVSRVYTPAGDMEISAQTLATPTGRYLVELGTSLQPIDAAQSRLFTLLGLLLPVLVICAAGGGYLLVHWALRPVERMSRTAEQISVSDPDARLPVAPTGDALQRLSISLNHMLSRLRESVQTSRRFLADASHELRTPLTVVKGELEELVRTEAYPSELRERVGSVLEEVARLEYLVTGLLALSRLDAGDAQREWVEVDLGELSASTLEQMRLLAEDRGVRLEAKGLRALVVQGDRGRLKQVIVNLIDNAIKFTPRGGIVTLQVERRDGDAVLQIRDTGIGIPAHDQPHIFDRFYRVDEARSREAGGAGLGLSIVRAICTAHGAQISVSSAPGMGSTFTLIFPARPGGADAPSRQPAAPQSRSIADGASPPPSVVRLTPH